MELGWRSLVFLWNSWPAITTVSESCGKITVCIWKQKQWLCRSVIVPFVQHPLWKFFYTFCSRRITLTVRSLLSFSSNLANTILFCCTHILPCGHFQSAVHLSEPLPKFVLAGSIGRGFGACMVPGLNLLQLLQMPGCQRTKAGRVL